MSKSTSEKWKIYVDKRLQKCPHSRSKLINLWWLYLFIINYICCIYRIYLYLIILKIENPRQQRPQKTKILIWVGNGFKYELLTPYSLWERSFQSSEQKSHKISHFELILFAKQFKRANFFLHKIIGQILKFQMHVTFLILLR